MKLSIIIRIHYRYGFDESKNEMSEKNDPNTLFQRSMTDTHMTKYYCTCRCSNLYLLWQKSIENSSVFSISGYKIDISTIFGEFNLVKMEIVCSLRMK